jgi:hypothetical protein
LSIITIIGAVPDPKRIRAPNHPRAEFQSHFGKNRCRGGKPTRRKVRFTAKNERARPRRGGIRLAAFPVSNRRTPASEVSNMKKWIAVLTVAALILGGAAACERKEYNQELSRADADTAARTGAPTAPMNEPATGMRAPANPNTGAQAEASATANQKILTGKMDVQDEDARTFIIEGNAQTYVAPQQADLDSLDGEQVTVRLDPNGRVQSIQAMSDREG